MTPDGPVRIDEARVRDMAEGCGWSLAELADFYAPRARREFADVANAHAAGDAETLARVAHGAAGSTSTMGLDSLAELYRAIERRPPDATLAALGDLLRGVGAHLESSIAALEELARTGD